VNLHQDAAAIERETAAWIGVTPTRESRPPRTMDDEEE
jgi:hypothetical protein